MINKSQIVKDAQKFVAKGQLDKAIAEYSKIIAAFPGDTNTLNTIGDLYLKVNNKDKAIDAFKSAADVLNRDGFALKAIALYKKVLNINPNQIDVQMQMGKLNADRGMLGNANENYLTAASYFVKSGKRDRALEVYKILCNLNPRNTTLAQKLAELYMSEGMEAEGLSKLVDLAEIKLQDGNIADAKQFLDKARKKGSGRQDFMRVNALINLKEGRLPEAVSELEDLRKLDPGDARVLGLLSDAYLHSGRYEDASAVIDELLDQSPEDNESRKKLISIFIKSGDFDEAWDHYRFMVEGHIEKKEHDKAQKLIQEYLEYNKDSIEARQLLADMFTGIGREDRVSELHAEMADIYARTGEYEKALNIYNKLLERDPDNEGYKTALKNLGQLEAGGVVAEAGARVPAPPDSLDGFDEPAKEEAPSYGTVELTEEAEPFLSEQTHKEKSFDLSQEEEQADEHEETFSETYAAGEQTFDMSQEEGQEEAADSGGGGNIYDLSDVPDELPPLDLGADTDDVIFSGKDSESGVYDMEEEPVGDVGDLDIFGSGSGVAADLTGPDEESGTTVEQDSPPPFDLEAGGLPKKPAVSEAHVFQAGSSFEDSLTEADVYIKYGLFPKAHEILSALESTHPSNAEIHTRYLEICKAQNDLDGFVDRSLQLAAIYRAREMDVDAAAVLEKAAVLSPDDERLRINVEAQTPEAQPEPPAAEVPGHAAKEPDAEDSSIARGFSADVETGFAPGSTGFLEELAEADFYSNQGLYEDARAIYRRLLASDPENDDIRAKYNKVVDMEQEAMPEPEVFPSVEEHAAPVPAADNEMDEAFREIDIEMDEPAVESRPSFEGPASEAAETYEEAAGGEDDDFFDLAAELREEMGQDVIAPIVSSSSFSDNNLEQAFQEFRKGVNDQLGSEDYETHYNLGIAYKEMGMIDEAITEFGEASKDPSRALDCSSMLGLCHLEKGEYGKAIEHFKKGLAIKGRDKEEYFGLKYDMATAYELSGDAASAFSAISDIYNANQEFRDVKKRYQRLEKSVGPSTDGEGAGDKDAKTRKSRVSYL